MLKLLGLLLCSLALCLWLNSSAPAQRHGRHDADWATVLKLVDPRTHNNNIWAWTLAVIEEKNKLAGRPSDTYPDLREDDQRDLESCRRALRELKRHFSR